MNYGENQRVINEVDGNYMTRPIAESAEVTRCVNCDWEDENGFVGGICEKCRIESYQNGIEQENSKLRRANKKMSEALSVVLGTIEEGLNFPCTEVNRQYLQKAIDDGKVKS